MHGTSLHKIRTAVAAVLLTITPVLAGFAEAQGQAATTLDISGGWVAFPDDGIVSETAIGTAGRFSLSPRLAVGPEALLISGDSHGHLMLTGNLWFDVIPWKAGRPPKVTPFLVAGGGMFHTWESFGGGDSSHTEGAFTAGGGVRAAVGDRTTLGLDVRIGWEAHLRLSGVVGFRLGR